MGEGGREGGREGRREREQHVGTNATCMYCVAQEPI